MIDIQTIWDSQYALLVPNPNISIASQQFANYVSLRVTSKMQLALVTGAVVFTFDQATFASVLSTITPSPEPTLGAQTISNSFQQAVQSSVMVVPSGAYIGSPTPATTWSAPPSVTPNAGTLSSAKSFVFNQLLTAPPSSGPTSKLALILRTAFTMLSYDVVGINSVPPPGGPNPLVVNSAVL